MQVNAKLFEFLIAPQGGLKSLPNSGNIADNQGEILEFSDLLANLMGTSGNPNDSFMALNADEMNFLSGLLPELPNGTQDPLILPLVESVETQFKNSANPTQSDETNVNINKQNFLSGLTKIKGQEVSFDQPGTADELIVEESSLKSSVQSKTANGISVSNALKMNQFVDSSGLSIISQAQAEKGGPSSFHRLVALTDLENLKPNESLIEVLSSKDGNQSTEVKFTKTGDEQVFEGKSYTPLELTVKKGDETKLFQAALVKDNSSTNSVSHGIDELLNQIEKVNGQKAQLVLFQSEKDLTGNKLANFTNQYVSGVNEEFQSLNNLFSSDASMQVRKFQLQNSQSQPGSQPGISGNSENGMAVVEAIVPDGSDPRFGQSTLKQTNENSMGFINSHESSEKFKLETLLEGNSGVRTDSQITDSKTNLVNRINPDINTSAKQPEFNSPVEFKLEMPRGGEKIPESGYFRIKLQPESLGKIDVQLKVVGSQMVARMEVETPLAKQAVEANLAQLKETLHDNGIKVNNISVDVSTHNDKNNEQFKNHQLARNLRQRYLYDHASMESADADQAIEAINQMNRSTNLRGSMSLFA